MYFYYLDWKLCDFSLLTSETSVGGSYSPALVAKLRNMYKSRTSSRTVNQTNRPIISSKVNKFYFQKSLEIFNLLYERTVI